MAKVTTITPCHNSTKYLRTCWESLKDQTIGLENMQIIFVDDASDDDGATVEMLKEIESEAPDSVTVILLEENLRQGGARNVALTYAEGEYVQFLDSDDHLEVHALERLYAMAVKNDTDIIQFDFLHPQGKPEQDPYCRKEVVLDLTEVYRRKEFLMSGLFSYSHHTKFYRRRLLEKANVKFAEHVIFEEPLFVYPLFFVADKVMVTTLEVYGMRHHSESTMASSAAERLMDHTYVQDLTFEKMQSSEDIYHTYYREIDFYFLWTYWVETVVNVGNGGKITLSEWRGMQERVRTLLPNYRDNIYLIGQKQAVDEAVDAVDRKFDSEAEIYAFAKKIAADYR